MKIAQPGRGRARRQPRPSDAGLGEQTWSGCPHGLALLLQVRQAAASSKFEFTVNPIPQTSCSALFYSSSP